MLSKIIRKLSINSTENQFIHIDGDNECERLYMQDDDVAAVLSAGIVLMMTMMTLMMMIRVNRLHQQ